MEPLSRAEFCVALFELGVLDVEQSARFAGGTVLPEMWLSISGLPDAERVRIAVELAVFDLIDRSALPTERVRVALNMTEAQMDEVFNG